MNSSEKCTVMPEAGGLTPTLRLSVGSHAAKTLDSNGVTQRKRFNVEMAARFLKEVDGWQISLARNIALRNQDLSAADLNAVVQRSVTCLVFLRLAEDAGIEPFGQLRTLCDQPGIYARFVRTVCRQAAEKYRSGLFGFEDRPDGAAAQVGTPPALGVDDEACGPILQSLYHDRGDCGFRVWPVEILGTVYERLLGKFLRPAAGHPIQIEHKPGARKPGGVYYTPPGIVQYLVQRTVGAQIAGRSPAELAGGNGQPPFRILDMACGSGSFLLEAYQSLLDHCLNWYRDHGPRAGAEPIFQDPRNGSWRLTSEEKNRLLTTHVFGVDVDPRAIEVTKLSLLLKALEGQEDARLSSRGTLSSDRILPCLDENIQCGDALIGPDFDADRQRGLFEGKERPEINVFDWQTDFPDVLTSGGFDAIIGNPPYVNARIVFQQQGEAIKQYFARRYQTARRGYDLYVLFVEKSLELLRDGGRCGLILPNKIAAQDYAEACRALLLEQPRIESITDVSAVRVFPTAGVYPYLMVWQKTPPEANHLIRVLHAGGEEDLQSEETLRWVRQQDLSADAGLAIHGTLDVESRVPTQPLARRAALHSGTTGFAAQRLADALYEQADAPGGECFEFVVSGNIDRYFVGLGNVRFMHRQFVSPVLPADCRHLTPNKQRLFRERKLIIAGMTRRLEAAPDDRGGLALGVSVYAVADMIDDSRYLLGLLNSRLLSHLFRIRFHAKHLSGGFLAINKGQLARLPIRVIDFAVAEDRRKHDEVVALAEQMTVLIGRRAATGADHADSVLEGQIASTDAAIDRLVYGLYGLTDDEIRAVEASITQDPAHSMSVAAGDLRPVASDAESSVLP